MTGGEDIQMLRGKLARDVASQLWAVYHNDPGSPYLIWPQLRGAATRVSEQESKMLISQWLQQHDHHYSVETPTTKTYRQKGKGERSARIDVTIYSSRNATSRVLNIELKGGTSSDTNFSKDFEKLIRETVPGLWFHTLEKADPRTWRTIENRICRAFDVVRDFSLGQTHTIHFAFCVLESREFVEFTIDFGQDWHSQLRTIIRRAIESQITTRSKPRAVQLAPSDRGETWQRSGRSTSQSASSRTGKTKQLVLLPSLEPTTVLHLSTSGASYRLRYFDELHPTSAWKASGCETLDDLLQTHPPTHTINVISGARAITDTDYWMKRVRECNEELKL
jgi:hypothetical protein